MDIILAATLVVHNALLRSVSLLDLVVVVAAMTDSILCLCAGRFNGSQDSTLQVTVLGARRALRMRGHEERSFSSSGCLSVRPFVRYRRRRSGLADCGDG